MKRLLIILTILCQWINTASAQKLQTTLEFGPATNLEGPVGFTLGFSHFDKLCVFFDYLGIMDKDGFIYHEFSPKVGLYTKDAVVRLSFSAGFAMAFYPEAFQNEFGINRKTSPFVGIPIQARIDFSPETMIGCGIKVSYIPSLTEKYAAHEAFSLFLSIRLSKNDDGI